MLWPETVDRYKYAKDIIDIIWFLYSEMRTYWTHREFLHSVFDIDYYTSIEYVYLM